MSTATIDWDAVTAAERDRVAVQVLGQLRDRTDRGSEEYEALFHAIVVLKVRIAERAVKAAGARA